MVPSEARPDAVPVSVLAALDFCMYLLLCLCLWGGRHSRFDGSKLYGMRGSFPSAFGGLEWQVTSINYRVASSMLCMDVVHGKIERKRINKRKGPNQRRGMQCKKE